MKRFTLQHELDCTREEMWHAFLSTPDIERLYKELEFPKYRVIALNDTPTLLTRRAEAVPKLNLPGPVAKILGANFGYTEEGTFDKAAEVWRFTMTPTTLADKLRHVGSMRVNDIGPGKVCRVVDLELEASVFGLGGLIEAALEKQLRDVWDKSAVATNTFFRKQR